MVGRSWPWTVFLVLGLASGGLAQERPAGPVPAEPPKSAAAKPASAAKPSGVSRKSVLSVFRPDNPLLWPLAICSIVTLGFTLERTIALRRGRVVPRDFVARFVERLGSGKLDRDRAAELCKANDSPVARVFGHAVRYWGQPATEIRQALDHDAGAEILDLKRNCRALNGTATLAPLLGLLGTVVGMIEAFDSLSSPQVAGMGKSEALAHGISLALVTTALGLGIAIVSVVAYSMLLHKVDVLAGELDDSAQMVIDLVSGENGRAFADRRGTSGPNDSPRHARTEAL